MLPGTSWLQPKLTQERARSKFVACEIFEISYKTKPNLKHNKKKTQALGLLFSQ